MMEKNLFIVQGGAWHLESLRDEAANPDPSFQCSWTCPRTARAGDLLLIYLLAPVSAVVARAAIAGEPFVETDESSDWFGKSMVGYENLEMLGEPIKLSELSLLFPEWHWAKRPQGSVKIPDTEKLPIRKPFIELLTQRSISKSTK